jgi:hypothetical protein
MSAIGVPGMAAGEGNVNLTAEPGFPSDVKNIPLAPMRGYLTPDQYDGQGEAEAARMAADLAALPADHVVMIEAVNNLRPGENGYRQPVGPIRRAVMVRLANAVANLGGTRLMAHDPRFGASPRGAPRRPRPTARQAVGGRLVVSADARRGARASRWRS